MPSPFPNRHLAYLAPWFKDVSQARMESLGVTGGFSGAVIWRVSMPADALGHSSLCLRRWPQVHPSLPGLLAIHGLLKHVSSAGYDVVPVPLPTKHEETYFVHEDHLWELTPWLPGEPLLSSAPTPDRLAAAMVALARFHQAAQTYRIEDRQDRLAPSPGLQDRLAMLTSLQQGELQQLWLATRTAEASNLRELAFELLEGIGHSLNAVASYLSQIAHEPLPLQWCLRDVRHDDLLFNNVDSAGEKVSGLLDFGAVGIDSVAGDLARLLGSVVNDHPERWQAAITAYDQQRPISTAERRAIVGFDHGGLLCSATNWVRWLFVEGRSFPQIHALHDQLLWLRNRLQSLASLQNASTPDSLCGSLLSPPHSAIRGSSQQSPSSGSGPRSKGTSPWMHT